MRRGNKVILVGIAAALVLMGLGLWSSADGVRPGLEPEQAPSASNGGPGSPRQPGPTETQPARDDDLVAEPEAPTRSDVRDAPGGDASKPGWLLTSDSLAGVTPISLPAGWVLDGAGQERIRFGHRVEKDLSSLDPGTYSVACVYLGWRLEPAAFVLEAAEATRVAVEFHPTNSYSGRVYDRATAAPIDAIEVTATFEDLSSSTPMRYVRALEPIEDSEGRFRLGGASVASGRVQFDFSADGYESAKTAWMDAHDGAAYTDLVIELEPDIGPTAWMEGRVLDAEQRPVSGADVSAYRLDGGHIFGTLDSTPRPQLLWDTRPATTDTEQLRTGVTTDASGAFSLGLDADEPYQLIVAKPGYITTVYDSFTLDAGERDHEEILLHGGARLSGRVLGNDAGPPASSVGISGPSQQIVPVAEDGTFEAIGLADGSYKATAMASDLLPIQTQAFEVAGGRDVEVDILCGDLRGGATLRGRVKLPAGVEGLQFRIGAVLEREASSVDGITALGPDGTFELHGLPDEPRHRIFVAIIGAKNISAMTASPVRVIGAAVVEDPSALLVVDAAATLVRITYAGERAPQGEEPSCYLTTRSGDPRFRVMLPDVTKMFLAPEREFVIHGLPAGEYALEGVADPIDVTITATVQTHVIVPAQ